MELKFVESNALGKTKAWESEFEATADFNLHIERPKGGMVYFYQKTAGTGYAHVDNVPWMSGKNAIDLDFTALVYPKWIKIVTEVEPTLAVVTFAQ